MGALTFAVRAPTQRKMPAKGILFNFGRHQNRTRDGAVGKLVVGCLGRWELFKKYFLLIDDIQAPSGNGNAASLQVVDGFLGGVFVLNGLDTYQFVVRNDISGRFGGRCAFKPDGEAVEQTVLLQLFKGRTRRIDEV